MFTTGSYFVSSTRAGFAAGLIDGITAKEFMPLPAYDTPVTSIKDLFKRAVHHFSHSTFSKPSGIFYTAFLETRSPVALKLPS